MPFVADAVRCGGPPAQVQRPLGRLRPKATEPTTSSAKTINAQVDNVGIGIWAETGGASGPAVMEPAVTKRTGFMVVAQFATAHRSSKLVAVTTVTVPPAFVSGVVKCSSSSGSPVRMPLPETVSATR